MSLACDVFRLEILKSVHKSGEGVGGGGVEEGGGREWEGVRRRRRRGKRENRRVGRKGNYSLVPTCKFL